MLKEEEASRSCPTTFDDVRMFEAWRTRKIIALYVREWRNEGKQTNVDAATKVEKPHHDWLRGRQKHARIITVTSKSVKRSQGGSLSVTGVELRAACGARVRETASAEGVNVPLSVIPFA
jgi:hypothetical protein